MDIKYNDLDSMLNWVFYNTILAKKWDAIQLHKCTRIANYYKMQSLAQLNYIK